MARRNNPMLAKIELHHLNQMRIQRSFIIIQCRDMLTIAANAAFGFGPERLGKLLEAYDNVFAEYAAMAVTDSEADADMDYTKGKLDSHLRRILGDENFKPWEERYAEIEKYFHR